MVRTLLVSSRAPVVLNVSVAGSPPEEVTVPYSFTLPVSFPTSDGFDLVRGPLTYNTDGLATVHDANFLTEPTFAEACELGMQTGHHYGADVHVEWRIHVACWAAWHGAQLEGDFVECGVNTGILSRAVCHYLQFEQLKDRRFYLIDTYAGIPVEQAADANAEAGMRALNAEYYKFDDLLGMVTRTFSAYPNVEIVQGAVPDVLARVTPEKVAYLSIDMNGPAAEIAAGEWFWDRLVPGAIMVLDDYGFGGHHVPQRIAWDDFAKRRGLKVLSMPTGQGLIIKP